MKMKLDMLNDLHYITICKVGHSGCIHFINIRVYECVGNLEIFINAHTKIGVSFILFNCRI